MRSCRNAFRNPDDVLIPQRKIILHLRQRGGHRGQGRTRSQRTRRSAARSRRRADERWPQSGNCIDFRYSFGTPWHAETIHRPAWPTLAVVPPGSDTGCAAVGVVADLPTAGDYFRAEWHGRKCGKTSRTPINKADEGALIDKCGKSKNKHKKS